MGLIDRAKELVEKLPRESVPSFTNSEPSKKKKKFLDRVQEVFNSISNLDFSDVLKEKDDHLLLDMDEVNSRFGTSTLALEKNTVSTKEPATETEVENHFANENDEEKISFHATEKAEELEIFDIDSLPDFAEPEEELKTSFELDNTPEKEVVLEDFAGKKETVDIGEDVISIDEFSEDRPEPEETIELESNQEIVDDSFAEWEKDAREESSKDPLLNLEDSIMDEISKEELTSEDLVTSPPLDNLKNDLEESKKVLEEQISASQEELEALQRKTESYLVLVEITKELVKSKNFEDFFENLMYSIEGQLGPEVVLLFAIKERNGKEFHLVAYDGIEIEIEPFIPTDSALAQRIKNNAQVNYASRINKEGFTEHELMIVENPTSEIIAPIFFEKELVGFMITGKLMTEEDYTEDDFEFLKLLGDISGNFIMKMFDFLKIREEVSQLNESIKYHESLANLSNLIYSCKSIGELYEKTSTLLEKDLSVIKHTLFLISEHGHEYRAFQSNYFSQETISSLAINVKSKLVTLVSQVTGMYKIENFNSYAEFKEIIPEKELSGMKEFSVFPLIHMGKLFGLFVVHEIGSENWTSELKQTMISASNLISPAIVNFVLQTEKDVVFKNPFNPLQESVDREIELATTENARFTLVVLKILNVSRIINLLGLEFFSAYSDFVISKIQSTISESDYFARVGQGKFAIFLRGKNKGQSEEFFNLLKSEFVKFPDPPKNFKLSIQLYSLTYPDQAKDKRRFIELIEDT